MSGKRESAGARILKAIDFGLLPNDEMQRRLMDLIMEEVDRTDGPADEELILTCLDLMDILQGRGHEVDMVRIDALNQRIAAAIQKVKKREERMRIALRTIGTIAAILVLVVGICVPLRLTWFESWSTPDEQQHVIMGHEITVEMVASAIADNKTNASITISDLSEFEQHLGFNPGIPARLGQEWVADYGAIRFFTGYIKLTIRYTSLADSNTSLTCTINYYDDVEYAYFSFEQNKEGTSQQIGDTEIYVSDNVDRATACWYDSNKYVLLSGNMDADKLILLITELIGGTIDE